MHRNFFNRKCNTNLCYKSVFMTWIIKENHIEQRPEIYGSILGSFFSGTKSLSNNIDSISLLENNQTKRLN